MLSNKKTIFIAICMALIIYFATTSFTDNYTETVDINSSITNVDEIDNGHIFVLNSGVKKVVILTKDDDQLITISIKYSNKPNTVYEWIFTDYPVTNFSPNNNMFWNDIIIYAEDRMSDAKVIKFKSHRASSNSIGGSSGRDLRSNLKELIKTDEYDGILKHTSIIDGNVFQIYESMDFRLSIKGNQVLNNIKHLTTAIFSIFNETYQQKKHMIRYNCLASNYRYIRVNGSGYVYNITDKFIHYTGYEDKDLNSCERAYIDKNSGEIEYSHSEAYFNSYSSQIKDAYNMFKKVGQMD